MFKGKPTKVIITGYAKICKAANLALLISEILHN
jgi:hypothetical protein